MSACAGQRTSGEASGWVWWSISRTDWNHRHGCSHGVGASQPKQQGSTVQLQNIISSPVPLSARGAQLGAAAQLEGVVRHDVPPVRRTHTCMECAPLKSSAVTLKPRAAARSSARHETWSNFRPHPVVSISMTPASIAELAGSCSRRQVLDRGCPIIAETAADRMAGGAGSPVTPTFLACSGVY